MDLLSGLVGLAQERQLASHLPFSAVPCAAFPQAFSGEWRVKDLHGSQSFWFLFCGL